LEPAAELRQRTAHPRSPNVYQRTRLPAPPGKPQESAAPRAILEPLGAAWSRLEPAWSRRATGVRQHSPGSPPAALGGADRVRTDDLRLARAALSQLSYSPFALGVLPPRCRPREPAAAPRASSVVGLGRLELPTSRLSGVRSNQLSYRPRCAGRAGRPNHQEHAGNAPIPWKLNRGEGSTST
jgi:hypothetical protein